MVNELRCARLDASAPDPSVEALLHALLPFPAVQHSHADAIVTLTNLADGADVVRRVFGDDVIVVPYKMPGFDLARAVADLWDERAHPGTIGLVLLNHGLFTVGADTREAYERHIGLLDRAERYLAEHAPRPSRPPTRCPSIPMLELAATRAAVSAAAGVPMIVSRHSDASVAGFRRPPRPGRGGHPRPGYAGPHHPDQADSRGRRRRTRRADRRGRAVRRRVSRVRRRAMWPAGPRRPRPPVGRPSR